MFDRFKEKVREASEFGPIAQFFTFFQGRCTTFAIFFGVIGLVMAGVGVWGFIHGKDLTSFASFVSSFAIFAGAIFTGLVAHSTKEDWMQLKQQQQQNVTVDVTNAASQVTNVAPNIKD